MAVSPSRDAVVDPGQREFVRTRYASEPEQDAAARSRRASASVSARPVAAAGRASARAAARSRGCARDRLADLAGGVDDGVAGDSRSADSATRPGRRRCRRSGRAGIRASTGIVCLGSRGRSGHARSRDRQKRTRHRWQATTSADRSVRSTDGRDLPVLQPRDRRPGGTAGRLVRRPASGRRLHSSRCSLGFALIAALSIGLGLLVTHVLEHAWGIGRPTSTSTSGSQPTERPPAPKPR